MGKKHYFQETFEIFRGQYGNIKVIQWRNKLKTGDQKDRIKLHRSLMAFWNSNQDICPLFKMKWRIESCHSVFHGRRMDNCLLNIHKFGECF